MARLLICESPMQRESAVGAGLTIDKRLQLDHFEQEGKALDADSQGLQSIREESKRRGLAKRDPDHPKNNQPCRGEVVRSGRSKTKKPAGTRQEEAFASESEEESEELVMEEERQRVWARERDSIINTSAFVIPKVYVKARNSSH
jgi:hypothetical protein